MEVTPNHPLYIESRGWVNAEDVAIGDSLRRKDGGFAQVLSIERVVLDRPEVVYNFTVKGLHTYFVLDVGVLVHNCGDIPLKKGTTKINELPVNVNFGGVTEKVEWVDIEKIVPFHPPNFSKNSSKQAFENIRATGFNVEYPVLLLKAGNGYIVEGGHHRLATVGLSGYKRVPSTIVGELSSLPEHQIRYIANRIFLYGNQRRLPAFPPFFEHAEEILQTYGLLR